jgi:mannose-6-phosphate isomerase-like protein (cupin superfamily)
VGDGVVNGPGEGEALRNAANGRVALVKGALPHLEVYEFTIHGPFDGPDPHTHDSQTDAFYVLEGEIDFHVDGREFRGGPGTYVAAPPGTPHGFKKRDTGTARFLNIHAPGVFLESMRRMSDPPEGPASTEPGEAEDVPTAD